MTISEAIKEIVDKDDDELFKNSNRFKAYLSDLCADNPKELKIIKRALDDKILARIFGNDRENIKIARLKDEFEEQGLSDFWSDFIINSFSEVLGWNYESKEITDNNITSNMYEKSIKVTKTLILGIGTSGQNVCEWVANNLNGKYGDYKKASWVGIKVLETAYKSDVIERNDFIGMSVEPSAFADYVSGYRHFGSDFGWNEWGEPNLLKNVGSCINCSAGNIRMAGRLAFFHNYEWISSELIFEIERLQKLTEKDIQRDLKTTDNIDIQNVCIQVYVVGSLCGGTGSGCCSDLGYLLRLWGNNNVQVTAIFTLPHWSLQNPRLKKNAFIALTELNHYMSNDSTWSQKLLGLSTPVVDSRRPYDIVYLTQPANGMYNEITKNESTIASFLTAACTETSHYITAVNVDGMNVLSTNRQLGDLSPTFSSFGIAVLEYPAEHVSRMCKERMLQKIYGCWKDNPEKDVSQGRNELFEKTPEFVIAKFYNQLIIEKYEKRMKEEFEKQKFDKNSSIHNKMDVIFSTITKEIHDDFEINKRADDWIDNFLKNAEDKFSNISKKYLTSLTAGPGVLARILKQTKTDIDAWSMPKGDIERAYNNSKSDVDTNRKNIKKKVDDYLNIKGLFFLIGVKQKEAWEDVVESSISNVEYIIKFVAAEKVKTFFDSMVYGNNTIQNKYNLFADKYIQRLENFESAIVAMHKYHEDIYREYFEKVPYVNGRQFYKNNRMTDEVDEIYNMVIKDSNANPNISIEKCEFDMASSVVEKLKDDLVLKLTGSMSCFDSRFMSDVKEYIPKDIVKSIDIKAFSFFSDISNYRNIIYEAENNYLNCLKIGSKSYIQTNQSPIPLKFQFQSEPNVGDINLYNYLYAFCPQRESTLATKENIINVKKILSKVQLTKPVFDNNDPYRIMFLRVVHGASLAHMTGIMKVNAYDIQALEDSMSCNDFYFWNTRKDVDWILVDPIDNIKQYWLVYRLIGNYRDKSGNYLICDKDDNPSPWYDINDENVVFYIERKKGVEESFAVISQDEDFINERNLIFSVDKENIALKFDLKFDKAVRGIAKEVQRGNTIKKICQNKIESYIAQVGKTKFIEILFKCLDNLDSYYLDISKYEAEKYIIEYCFLNNLTEDYINLKFPKDKPIDASLFSQLWHSKDEVFSSLKKMYLPKNTAWKYYYPLDGYYCPNGHRLGIDDVEATLRMMINDKFICPHCFSMKTYWPY